MGVGDNRIGKERSCLKTEDLLGVLNHYIEDLRLRVVIVSNEQKLNPVFGKLKEKLIGQTIQVVPQVTEAYEAFVLELDTPVSQSFATTHKEWILRLFTDSGCCSLRVLRHVLHDLGRLRNVLSDNHLANASAIYDLVSVFCTRDIEIRSGNIDEIDLREKAENPYAFMFEMESENGNENQMSRIVQSETKFPLVNFQSDLLNITVVIDMLVKGRFVKKDITESIDASLHYQNPDDLPPWRVIMQFDALEDVTIERAIERMKEQLQNHEVTEIGEMLHVFSLMMMMSENDIIDEDIANIMSCSKSYIDHLVEHNKLATIDETTVRVVRVNQAYEGYGYHVPDAYTQEFNELKEYVIAANCTVYQRQLPDAAEELLTLMADDPQQFVEQICHTNSDERNHFASVPILLYIEPARFVDAWMRCPVGNWRTISTALDIRYEDSIRREILKDEHEWAKSVYGILQCKAERASRLTAWRLRRAIPKALEVLAGDADISELSS